MKNKVIKYLTTVALAGMYIGSTQSLAADKRYIPSGEKSENILGQGFDDNTDNFKGPDCVTGNLVYAGDSSSELRLDLSTDESEVAKEFGMSFKAKFKYAGGSTSIGAKFVKNSQDTKRSLNYNFIYKVDLQNAILKDVTKQSKWESFDDLKWTEGCGHSYVSQLVRGGRVIISLKVQFSSEADKRKFEGSVGVKGSFGSVAAAMNDGKSSFSKKTKVTLDAYQIGGDVGRLAHILKEGGVDAVTGKTNFIQCSMGDLSKCDNYLSIVQKYVSDEFVEQIASIKPERPSKPATLGYIVSSYKNAAIFTSKPQSELDMIIQVRNEVDKYFNKSLRVLGKTESLLRQDPYPLNEAQQKRIRSIQVQAEKNIGLVQETAEVCYNEIDKCEDKANAMRPQIIDIDMSDLVVVPKMFKQFCYEGYNNNEEPELAETIQTMIEVAKVMDSAVFTSDVNEGLSLCDKADSVFLKSETFDTSVLSNSDYKGKMYTIAPLMSYKHLTHIDVTDQKIDTISPLLEKDNDGLILKNLKVLNLSNNKLRDVVGVDAFTKLEQLLVADNDIREIPGVERLGELYKLDLRNNALNNKCPASESLKICMLESYRNRTQLIAQATLSGIKMGGAGVTKLGEDRFFISKNRSIEILDINTNTYAQSKTAMLYKRKGHTATELKDGRVLLVGGEGGGNYTAEIYDPVHETFVEVERELTSPRSNHKAVLLEDGRVLIAGGWEADGSMWSATLSTPSAEIYDPKTNKITQLPSMLAARQWHQMTKLEDGRVLITGGYSNVGGQATAEIFNPETDSFELLPMPMNEGRAAHGATTLADGRVLISGGISSIEGLDLHDAPKRSIEIFDPKSLSFEELPDKMKYARAFHTATTLSSGHVVLNGGVSHMKEILFDNEAPVCLSCVESPEIYNPKENSISTLGKIKFTYPRAQHFAFPVGENRVYLLGGRDRSSASTVEVFTYVLKK